MAASSPQISPDSYPGMQVVTPEAIQARTAGWQRRILAYATQVPEVAGAASLVRGSSDRVRLVIEGGDDALRAQEQAKLDALDFGRLIKLLWLSGEAYVAFPEGTSRPYSLSVDELDTTRKPYRVRTASSTTEMPDDFFRIWMPADDNRWKATSPNQSAMDLLDAMYRHQLADVAVANSRMASAGIMVMPTDKKRMGLIDGKPQAGSQEELLADFMRGAAKSLKDAHSLEAAIPYIIAVDPSQGSYKPEMIRIERDDYADQYASKFETYARRYFTAVDLPVEEVGGTDNASRFSVFQIREDRTNVYLMPFFELAAFEIWRRHLLPLDSGFRVKVDASKLVTKPDVTEVVMQMLALRTVTTESAIAAIRSSDLSLLETQDPGQDSYTSNAVNVPPSDFTVGGKRGGGQAAPDRGNGSFRERR